jgi:hypothetical protein
MAYSGTVSLQWAADATNWNTLIADISLPDENIWYGYGPVTLPAGAVGLTNLRFRFVFNRTGPGSVVPTPSCFRIDDFIVTGN